MQPVIKEVLISEGQIAQKVKEIGERISNDYQGKEVLIIGILKGSFVFMADLIRHLTIPVTVDFMMFSSYGTDSETSGVVRIIKDLEQSIEGKHVIVVEDIVDTGLTLKYLLDNLNSRKLASLKICTLLDKPSRRRVEIKTDYNGFIIPDKFVVGYGLDYGEKFRNLADIMVIKP